MFLRNDYFYTVINETPFRFVLEKWMFSKVDVSVNTDNKVVSLVTVWVWF